ncbi:unnamed protein product, partial [marine sediment metagenome]
EFIITGAIAPETPRIRLGRNFTMGGIKQQRGTKHRPELRIAPVSFLEKRAPVFNRDRDSQSDLPNKETTSAFGWNLLQSRGECL